MRIVSSDLSPAVLPPSARQRLSSPVRRPSRRRSYCVTARGLAVALEWVGVENHASTPGEGLFFGARRSRSRWRPRRSRRPARWRTRSADSGHADPAPPPVGARIVAWARLRNRLFMSALAAAAVLRFIVFVAYFPRRWKFPTATRRRTSRRRATRSASTSCTRSIPAAAVAALSAADRGHRHGDATPGRARRRVLVYRLLRGMQVGSAGATLAAAPLLFDAYQVNVEQFLLSDTVFTALVVVAMTLMARLLRRQSAAEGGGGTAMALGAVLTDDVDPDRRPRRTAAVLLGLLAARTGWRRLALAAAAVACRSARTRWRSMRRTASTGCRATAAGICTARSRPSPTATAARCPST